MKEDRRPERVVTVIGRCDFCEGHIDNCYQCKGKGSYMSTMDTETGSETDFRPVRVTVQKMDGDFPVPPVDSDGTSNNLGLCNICNIALADCGRVCRSCAREYYD